VTVLTFSLSVIFARFAAQVLYGQYKFAVSVFALLSILALPGMNTAIFQAIAKGANSAIVQGTRTKLKFAALASLPLAGIAGYLFLKGSNFGWAFIGAIPLFPLAYGFANSAFYLGKKRFQASGIALVFHQILHFSFISAAILLFQDAILVVVAYLLAQALANIVVYWLIIRDFPPFASDQSCNDSDFLRYGGHLTLMQVISSFAQQADKLLLTYFLGFQQVAIYAIAYVIPNMLKGLFKQISTLVFPRLTVTLEEKVYAKVKAKAFHLLVVGGLGTVILLFSLPLIIPFVYTERYIASIVPAQILGLSLVFVPLIQTLRPALLAHRKTQELYKFYLIASLSRLIMFFILIPFLGLVGAALSVFLSRIVAVTYLWYAVRGMSLQQ